MMKACLMAALWCALPAAHASDYGSTDSTDKDALERALYLCVWRTSHAIPEHAPIPAACTAVAVSIDDALLQSKQWWTFWARLNTDAAVQANARFGTDLQMFQARQRQTPQLAAELLPQGVKLPDDDWRVLLVRELMARRATAGP
jgi:hypothetical protein